VKTDTPHVVKASIIKKIYFIVAIASYVDIATRLRAGLPRS
jgi:hypothetical protein